MAYEQPLRAKISWRWIAALTLFLLALVGFGTGVSLTERPDVTTSNLLTKAYYSLGLFVVGGLDLGTPIGGPLLGRIMLWLAYFGAPMLTASAVIEAVIRVIAPKRWQLRRLKNHFVIVGSGDQTISYLRMLRKHSPNVPVVVVDSSIEVVREQELKQIFNASVVVGEITHDFLLRELRLQHARKVVLLGADDFQSYEAASKILRLFPHLESRIILHCRNLRFMRAMAETRVAKHCINFNSYHLAASAMVRDHLIGHFKKTQARDVVIMAGFGRFGQTILEELQAHAEAELETVVLIDVDAERRVLVADEQERIGGDYDRQVVQGNISNPEVWRVLSETVDLSKNEPTIILGTGQADVNLRTALWIKNQYPNTLVFARTNDISELAIEVGAEHQIKSFSIKQLVEDNIPDNWLQ